MRLAIITSLLIFATPYAYAYDECIQIDKNGWTELERHHYKEAVVSASQETKPVSFYNERTGKVCWDSPSVDLDTISSIAVHNTAKVLALTRKNAECNKIDTLSWTPEQKAQISTLAEGVARANGETSSLRSWDESGNLCWDSPTTDRSAVTSQALLGLYNTRHAALTARQQRLDRLETLETRLDALTDNWDNLTPQQKLLVRKTQWLIWKLRRVK